MSIEAMKQALEALEKCEEMRRQFSAWDIDPPLHHVQESHDLCGPAITSLRQAIAEAEKQKPLLLSQKHLEGYWCVDLTCKKCYSADFRFKHTHPAKREWVGLTYEEIDQGLLRSDYALKTAEAWRAGVVFAMTKLKEKNGYEEKNT